MLVTRRAKWNALSCAIKEAWVVVFRPNDMNVDACLREAHNKIIAYGESIKAKFDIDNLHLRSRELASDSTRVVTAVQRRLR